MEQKLTKAADKLLCEIYAAYIEKLDNGAPRGTASNFMKLFPPKRFAKEWQESGFESTLAELASAGLVKTYYGDFVLLDAGIIYMENRFGRKLSAVLDFIANLAAFFS